MAVIGDCRQMLGHNGLWPVAALLVSLTLHSCGNIFITVIVWDVGIEIASGLVSHVSGARYPQRSMTIREQTKFLTLSIVNFQCRKLMHLKRSRRNTMKTKMELWKNPIVRFYLYQNDRFYIFKFVSLIRKILVINVIKLWIWPQFTRW